MCSGEVIRPAEGNHAGWPDQRRHLRERAYLQTGDRLILVTDGVTEAENAAGDFFEDSRLEQVAGKGGGIDDVFAAIANFCDGTP